MNYESFPRINELVISGSNNSISRPNEADRNAVLPELVHPDHYKALIWIDHCEDVFIP